MTGPDQAKECPAGPEGRVTLLSLDGSYWLHEGETYIDALLSKDGYYPTPVHCLIFDNAFEMHNFKSIRPGSEVPWMIHVAIVVRLRADGELLETKPAAG